VEASYAPTSASKRRCRGITPSSTLTASFLFDGRQYVRVTKRSNLALRLFVGLSYGNAPTPFYFGGLGHPARLRLPGFLRRPRGVREHRVPLPPGRLRHQPGPAPAGESAGASSSTSARPTTPTRRRNSISTTATPNKLQDGRAALGWGITLNFAGLDLNWDFARPYRSPGDDEGFRTAFWIGTQF
jgi:hypothetical protein